MESGELGLVSKLCKSRNHLERLSINGERNPVPHHGRTWLSMARFCPLPRHRFYWILGRFFTQRPKWLTRGQLAKNEPLVKTDAARGGFEYSDAILYDNDARFVFGFVRRAMTSGCIAANYVTSHGGERAPDGIWHFDCEDTMTGRHFKVRARTLVNTCGPYVDAHNEENWCAVIPSTSLFEGIHLIVNRLSRHNKVLTFFADDGRPFFAIPMGPRTVIGTTDTRVPTPETQITDEDRHFVLSNINKRLNLDKPLTSQDVIAERCGVRPLVVENDGQETQEIGRSCRENMSSLSIAIWRP